MSGLAGILREVLDTDERLLAALEAGIVEEALACAVSRQRLWAEVERAAESDFGASVADLVARDRELVARIRAAAIGARDAIGSELEHLRARRHAAGALRAAPRTAPRFLSRRA